MSLMPINTLSRKYEVRPLEPGQTKVYRTIRSTKLLGYIKEKKTNKQVNPVDAGIHLPGKYTFWDDGYVENGVRGRNVLIMNQSDKVEQRYIQGVIHEVIVEKDVYFERGQLIITHEDQSALIWAERSNYNASNLKRKNKDKDIFMEVKPVNEVISWDAKHDMKVKALIIIATEIDNEKTAIQYIKGCNLTPAAGATLQAHKSQLNKFIEEKHANVKIFFDKYAGTDKEMFQAQVAIDTAFELNVFLAEGGDVLSKTGSSRRFIWNETNEIVVDEKGKQITSAEDLFVFYKTNEAFRTRVNEENKAAEALKAKQR